MKQCKSICKSGNRKGMRCRAVASYGDYCSAHFFKKMKLGIKKNGI